MRVIQPSPSFNFNFHQSLLRMLRGEGGFRHMDFVNTSINEGFGISSRMAAKWQPCLFAR